VDHFKVEASAGGNIAAQRAATPFAIKITAEKANSTTEAAFTGTVVITSTGTLTAGGGTTAAFTAGVLSSHNVTFGNTGSFTITATDGVTGVSNSFTVTAFTSDDFDAKTRSGMQPSCSPAAEQPMPGSHSPFHQA
jgi:hypothetical protein